jgi:hypothetical protein
MSKKTEEQDVRAIVEIIKPFEIELPRRRWVVCWTEDPTIADKNIDLHERILKRYKVEVESRDLTGHENHRAFVDHTVFFDEGDEKAAVALYRKVVYKSKATWCATMALSVLDTEC